MLCVSSEGSGQWLLAQQLASRLKLSLIPFENLPEQGYVLCVTPDRLLLQLRQNKQKHNLSVDFLTGTLGYRLAKGGGLQQSLAKAVGLKNRHQGLTILDGTAGLGKDAFVLAMLGCSVCLVERSPILFELLQDGIKRAENSKIIGEKVKNSMRLVKADFRDYVKTLPKALYPEVIYLDPMFPENKKSALTKMEMRIIRDIVGSDKDASVLLEDALVVAKKRVVVKRPLHASSLQGKKPSFVVLGKKNRYDVYLTIGGNIKIHE